MQIKITCEKCHKDYSQLLNIGWECELFSSEGRFPDRLYYVCPKCGYAHAVDAGLIADIFDKQKTKHFTIKVQDDGWDLRFKCIDKDCKTDYMSFDKLYQFAKNRFKEK